MAFLLDTENEQQDTPGKQCECDWFVHVLPFMLGLIWDWCTPA
jgi:hypothetical protein